MPLIILFCKKFKLYDPINARKIHSGNIPRLGGIAIVISFLLGTFAFFCFSSSEHEPIKRFLPIVFSSLLIFSFGLLDDIFDISPVFKLLVQMIAVVISIFCGYRFKSLFGMLLPFWASIALTFLWTCSLINAFNLIDGLDGLCGSISFLIFLTFGIITFLSHDLSGFFYFTICASLLGFLIFNLPPAKIFMGDCGSQFLGFLIAISPLYEFPTELEYNKVLAVLVLVSMPAIDMIAAIWRRIRDRKPIMTGDKLHLHHKLLNLGCSQKTTLLILCIVQILVCGYVTVSLLFLTKYNALIALILELLVQVILFSILHYVHYRRVVKNS